jgi:flagellar motor switch protein FliN
MPDDNVMDQNEIERLMSQAGPGGAPTGQSPRGGEDQSLDQSEIEALLNGTSSKSGSTSADQAPAMTPAADSDKMLAQDDIEKLLNQAGKAPVAAQKTPAPAQKQETPAIVADGEDIVAQEDVDYLLDRAERALRSIDSGGENDLPQGIAAFRLEEFPGAPASTEAATLDLIRDVELDLKIELGRTNMYLEDVLKLRKGSVVPLDKLAGDPVDVYVNERLVARGEVLVLNDSFCVRIAELIAGVGATS